MKCNIEAHPTDMVRQDPSYAVWCNTHSTSAVLSSVRDIKGWQCPQASPQPRASLSPVSSGWAPYFQEGEESTLGAAVRQALGSASCAWENPHLAGQFDEKEANRIADGLEAWVRGKFGLEDDERQPRPTALVDAASAIAAECRAAFPGADPLLQQAMCFVEELGEFQGAARRWLGLARREGNPRELAEELADVVIVTYVAAQVYRVEINEAFGARTSTMPDPDGAVWGLMVAGSRLVHRMDTIMESGSGLPNDMGHHASAVVALAHHVATVMDIDLNKEIDAKLKKIFQRGWRDSPKAEKPSIKLAGPITINGLTEVPQTSGVVVVPHPLFRQ